MAISQRFSRCKGLSLALTFSAATLMAQQGPTLRVPAQQNNEQSSDAPVTTIKVNVKVVNVLATVRDKNGKIVNNLSQSDFALTEDGRPQTIKYFTRDTDLPLTLGLLVDTSGSVQKVLEQERSASSTFIDSVLRENKDQAFLIHFDRQVELLQDLTKSPEKMSEALESVGPSAPDPNQSGGNQGGNGGGYPGGGGGYPGGGGGYPGGGGGRHGGYGHGGGGTHLYDAVYLASDELMAKEKGRKAVIILSDGVDHGSKEMIDQAIESAQRANTIVYSIYFKGQEGGYGNQGGYPGGRHGGMGGGIGFPGGGYPGGGGGYPGGGYPRGGQGGGPSEPKVDGKKILERISRETGGRMFEVKKNESVSDIYKEIQEELRNQYNIGYTPDQAVGEGYRKIDLTTKDKDYSVQARQGYYPAQQMESKGQGQ
jgi:VWFA-related protein